MDGAVVAGRKPLDVGNGRLVASFAASRPALLSVLSYHPEYGVAELSALPDFDEARRGDREYVRRHRLLMASDEFTCLDPQTADGRTSVIDTTDLADPERPIWHGRIGDTSFEAEARAERDSIVLEWRFTNGKSPAMRVRFRGRLDRPALAEITEVDPPLPTGAETTLRAEGSRLVVRSTLPATLFIDAEAGEWVVDGAQATIDPGSTKALRVEVRTVDELPRSPTGAEHRVPTPAAPLVARALAYVRGCTALRVGADEVVLLTDHRILPLSWTRDAYYQALLLLAAGEDADADMVADHLRWLWRRCERPNGRWLRSHHANGRPKDMAFQADQQLYPIIELADYWRQRGELPAGVDWDAEVARAWSAALAQVDAATGLIATTENAADDPAPAPFTASSQILLWYTAQRLAEMADDGELRLGAAALPATAAAVKAGFERYIVAGEPWLYATDAAGTRVDYHDANDLPVALAPLLGFCAADDPAWRATMDFGFSAANSGYFAGERGGLGSTHTPAPWTLGDVQAWVRARIVEDERGMAAAIERLEEVSYDDAMLPEAYSVTRDPDVRIRHWFAWPGAAIGALLVLDARGGLRLLRAAG